MRRSFSHPEMATFLKSIKPTAEEVKIANKILEASGKKEETKVAKKTGVGLKYWANTSAEFSEEDRKSSMSHATRSVGTTDCSNTYTFLLLLQLKRSTI